MLSFLANYIISQLMKNSLKFFKHINGQNTGNIYQKIYKIVSDLILFS